MITYYKDCIYKRNYSVEEIKIIIGDIIKKYNEDYLIFVFKDGSEKQMRIDKLIKIENYKVKRIVDEIKLDSKLDYFKVKENKDKWRGGDFIL